MNESTVEDSFVNEKKRELEKNKYKIKKKTYYYAVVEGHLPGIYYNWEDCLKHTKGYPDAIYKKFSKKGDALLFLEGDLTVDDFKVDESDISLLSINNKTIIDNDIDLTIFNIENFNKYKEHFYIFTDGSYYKQLETSHQNEIYKNKYKNKYKKNNMISKFGVYFGNKSINISNAELNPTHNQSELLGIKYALLVLDKYKAMIKKYQKEHIENKIYIVSDSEYCIKALTEWIFIWQKNSWKTKTYEEVKNKDLFIVMHLIMNKLKLHNIKYEFKHINSHRSPPLSNEKEMFLWKGNQLANYLAKTHIEL
jgi:ribonuclease HI